MATTKLAPEILPLVPEVVIDAVVKVPVTFAFATVKFDVMDALPEVMLLVTEIFPAVKLPVYVGKYAATFVFEYVPLNDQATPLEYNKWSVSILPAEALAVTLTLTSVPTDVILG